VWYKNLDRSFFRFVIIHAFDRQTDRRTDRILIAIPLNRPALSQTREVGLISCFRLLLYHDYLSQYSIVYYC